jgi:hypothetical protein
MAVSAMACSVIVRNHSVEARFPGGMASFRGSCPNESFCTDGTISRIGFINTDDARIFIGRLVEAGLAPSIPQSASEIALVVQGHGFSSQCDWLQLGLFEGHPCAWLAGSDRGSLFIPQHELNADLGEAIPTDEYYASYERIDLRAGGRVEVYRHRKTGKILYVGRPFNPVRKWWHFWRNPGD